MKVTIEITDYSKPEKPAMWVHNSWNNSGYVELEIENKRYTVKSEELISAVNRATLDVFGR